ncbi:MAG: DUF445 family protein [Cetobacterium sp.]|uniref:DUF445 domain-containing protein n=1 Tax=Cetobacterium ceti TaxID=180163 RepID=A0A1T4NYH5_9FUSO|nr:DUF445 family protein [Cetobacterium ceti]MCJ8341274.1 DUF445 family protein [Cetobacterium sp.]SJZ84450.1 Protein of unknown function [Cetobacterium ceti]
MLLQGILIVIIGALIGWITNYIAIKMLFRPYKEINFGLFKIQGLIPKRRHEIAMTIAETVQKELISMDDIIGKLKTSEMGTELENMIDEILSRKLKSEITSKFPMLAMFLNDSMVDKIKDAIKNTILENKDEILEKIFASIEKKVDFKEIIVERVDNFSLEQLEEITFSLAKKELKHIEVIGAVLGGLIGLVQFGITFIL